MICPELRELISNLQRQADASSTSTMDAILKSERILADISSQVQDTAIGMLDCTNVQFKLARLQMKAATSYGDDGDTIDNTDNDVNVSYVTLSTDHRVHLCEEAFEHITSCHELRKMILPSNHERVREANHLKEKAEDLLLYLKRFRSFEIWIARKHLFLQGRHAPAA